jgi:hypothetical protein
MRRVWLVLAASLALVLTGGGSASGQRDGTGGEGRQRRRAASGR